MNILGSVGGGFDDDEVLTNAVGFPIDDWNTLLYFDNRFNRAEEGQRKRRNFQGEIRE